MDVSKTRPLSVSPRGRRWRLRLLTAVIVTVICLPLGGWLAFRIGVWYALRTSPELAARMAAARAQRAAVDTLRSGNLGVWIVYDYQDDESDVPRALPGPTWQRLLFGVDFVSDVAWVHFYRGFPGPTFSDEALKPIADLKRLKGFRAPWSMSDAGLRYLAGLKELRGVDLSESRVTDAGLVNLQGLTKLESLNLNHTNITDAGLAHLEELSNLKKLYLENTRISDSGLYHLSRLAKLEDLLVASSRVTRDGAATLHRALPRCRVSPWQESLGPATVDNHEDGEANATK